MITYPKVCAYLCANGFNAAPTMDEVLLRQLDDGSVIIDTWAVDGVAKPTEAQLDSYDESACANACAVMERYKEFESMPVGVQRIIKKQMIEAGHTTAEQQKTWLVAAMSEDADLKDL